MRVHFKISVLAGVLCTLFFICQPLKGQAQSSRSVQQNNIFSGTVTDAVSATPLIGASIYFSDLRRGSITTALGAFEMKGLADGNYVVEVSFLGYASLARTITIKGNTVFNFQLSSSVVESEHVIVTGVSKATELRKSPVPISIMKKQDLYRSSATNIIEALTRKSGVSAVTTGPAIAKPFIRGMGYNRVITVNDGLRQEGQQWGDEHGIEIDEYSVQRAEVLRGPASLMYGSDAIGGVLNIISQLNVPQNEVKANVVLSSNSNNGMWGGHGNIAGQLSNIQFSAYGSYKSAGDYQNKFDGKVLNSRFNERDFGASLGLNRKWGFSHWLVSSFDQQTGLVEGERNDEGKFLLFGGSPLERVASPEDLKGRTPQVPYQRIRHFRIVSDNSFFVGKNRLSAVVGWQQNRRQEFGDAAMPDEPEAWFDLKTLNYNFGYHLQDRNGWKTSIGSSGMYQTNTNLGEEAIIPNYRLADAGLYWVVQKSLNKRTTISGGLRYDFRTMQIDAMEDDNGGEKFAQLKRNFGNVSGSIGISHNADNGMTFKANISRGFRAPNAAELSSNGAHEGTNRFEIGNPDLKSETTLQADIGLAYQGKHIQIGFTPFASFVSKYIFFQKLAAANGGDSLTDQGNGDFIQTFKFNQQGAKLVGFEINLDIHPHPLDWLHIENTVSYVRGWFNEAVGGSSNLPLMAPLRWLSEVRAEWGNSKGKGPLANAYFKMEMDANASQNRAFTAFDTETATKGFVLLNVGIGSDLKNVKGRVLASIFLGLNNLTDVGYQSHLSRLKYTPENLATGRMGVFNMGRNFTARVVIPMSWRVGN